MKVKDLIEILLDCDQQLDVVNSHYEDVYSVKEETVRNVRGNGEKTAASHVILEFADI
jgi:hypothetical protein